jgi:hypothetical protein
MRVLKRKPDAMTGKSQIQSQQTPGRRDDGREVNHLVLLIKHNRRTVVRGYA